MILKENLIGKLYILQIEEKIVSFSIENTLVLEKNCKFNAHHEYSKFSKQKFFL